MDERHPLFIHTAGLLACALGAACGSYEEDAYRETTVHHTHAVTTGDAQPTGAPQPAPHPPAAPPPQPPPQVVVVQTPPPQVVIMDAPAEPPPVYVAAPPAPPPAPAVLAAPPAPRPAPVSVTPPPPPRPALQPSGPAPVSCSGNQRVRIHDRKIEGGEGPAVFASGACVVTMTECIVRGSPAVVVRDQARVDLIECKILGDMVSEGSARIETRGSRHRGQRFHDGAG